MIRFFLFRFFHTFLFFSFFLGLAAPLRADDTPEDYNFYKKYGHSHKSWNDAVKQGFVAYEQQNCTAAVPYLKEALSKQCQDALVYYKLAVCTEMQESPYTAMQYYQLAEEKLNKLPAPHRYQQDIHESYGRTLYQAKRYEEALRHLSQAAAIGTPSFGLYYLVGSLYAQKNDWGAAREYFRKALLQNTEGIDPGILSSVYFEVAKIYFEAKDYKTTSALLDRSLQSNPQNQEAAELRNTLNTLLQQNSMVEMIQSLTQSQGKAPQGQTPPQQPRPPSNPSHLTTPEIQPIAPENAPQQLAPLPTSP